MEYMFEQWDKGEYVMAPGSRMSSKKAKKMELFMIERGVTAFVSVPIFVSGLRIGAINNYNDRPAAGLA